MLSRLSIFESFVLASLRDMSKNFQGLPAQTAARLWRDTRDVIDTAARLRREELERHERCYADRVAHQKTAVRDDDKPPHRKYEPWGFGGAQFDEDRVTKIARRRVDQAHTKRMDDITRDEQKALRAIKREARELKRFWGIPTRDFNRTAKRQSLRMRFHRYRD